MALRDTDRILRQARDSEDHYEWLQDADGDWRPLLRVKSAGGTQPSALHFNPDLSVQWREHNELHTLGLADLVRAKPEAPLVFEAVVGQVRELRSDDGRQMYVAYTPVSERKFGCSHASVLLLIRDRGADKRVRDDLEEDLRPLWSLVYGTPTVGRPEGG